MKKLISLLLVISMLIANAAFGTFSVAAATGGYIGAEGDGTNISWTFDKSTGTLSIVGTGKMKDWRHETPYDEYESEIMGNDPVYVYTPWFSFKDEILHATISDGITVMGNFTFGSCQNLKDVKLGKDLTNIGVGAFHSCTSLTSVDVPSKVTFVGVGAFYNATTLSSVSLPDGLTTIYYGAFAQCYKLNQLSIPSTVTAINAGAFAFSGIQSIVIPEKVAGISSFTFYTCRKLQSVTFLGDIKYINERAFVGCTNSNLILRIPESCNTIHQYALFESDPTFLIICYEGSYGEKYCKQYVSKSMYQVTKHEYVFEYKVSSTCTEQGYSMYYCEECDDYRKQDFVDALGHNLGNWSISSVATAERDGVLECTCRVCRQKIYKSYPYHMAGDADLDEELTVYDVILLLQQMAGIKEFDEHALSAGDINLNYKIDSEDATLLLQRISGSKVEFPSEQAD